MPDTTTNTIPKWKQDRCDQCKAGSGYFPCLPEYGTLHVDGEKCTAPTEAEYIAQLEGVLDQADITIKAGERYITAMEKEIPELKSQYQGVLDALIMAMVYVPSEAVPALALLTKQERERRTKLEAVLKAAEVFLKADTAERSVNAYHALFDAVTAACGVSPAQEALTQ